MNTNQQRHDQRVGRSNLRKNVFGRYALEQSPLWRLNSIHRLAAVLQVDAEFVRDICLNSRYREFEEKDVKPGKTPRAIQVPIGETLKLHYRIVKLLDSIERPDFLHSATKRRSHITNAMAHMVSTGPFVSIDIRKFFESTTYIHVKKFFRVELQCSHDIAKYLATLCTANGHLPTGSCLSALLSYFVHRRLFDQVSKLCKERDVVMTLYVDDMTFSGVFATKTFQFEVQALVKRAGLKTHPLKNVCISPGKPTIVTGVIVKNNEILIRNRQHRRIVELQNAVTNGESSSASQLAGHMAAAKAVDEEAAKKLGARFFHLERTSQLKAHRRGAPNLVR